MTKNVNIETIRIDGGTQARAALNNEAIAEYAQALRAGDKLPPVALFFDGTDNWLADGFHRYHAYRAAGLVSVSAEVVNGSQRSALMYALGANREHGLRRTNADKRRAVELALADAEWAEWSDRKIAELCGVTHPFVAGIRKPKVVTVTTPRVEKDAAPARKPTAELATASESAPVPASAAAPVADITDSADGAADGDSDFEMAEALTEALDKNVEMEGRVSELQAILDAEDGGKAQAAQWQRRCIVAEQRTQDHLKTIEGKDKRIGFLTRLLTDCGKAVGEKDLDQIPAAVKKMAKAAKVAP